MRDNKKDGSDKTPEQEALERRVDAMMDLKLPDEVPKAEKPSPPAAEKVAIKSLKSAKASRAVKTAPQLPVKLDRKIKVSTSSAGPISIDELDKITESMAGPKASAKPEAVDKTGTDESDKPDLETDIDEQSADLEDTRTDEAVDDIVAHEGDVMLAVADATAAEHNRKAAAVSVQKDKKGTFSTIMWALVFIVAVLALVLLGLLITGGDLSSLHSL